jgi:hypothetical protein
MPALVFPPTPAAGDIHDENGRKWRRSSKGVWESYPLATGSAPGTPDAPTLVEATTTTLEVEVDAVSGATGYKWYLDTVFVASSSSPTYTFTGLDEDTEYDITVSATNAYGESAQSAALVVSTSSGFTYYSAIFDGSDHLSRGSPLTGLADGDKGLASFWVKMDGGSGDTTNYVWMINNNARFRIERNTSGKVNFVMRNASNTIVLQGVSTANVISSTGWVHVLCSWDLDVAGRYHMYVNGSVQGSASTFTENETIDYNDGNNFFVGGWGASNRHVGLLSEVYFTTEYLDLSVEANRLKFRTAGGKPENPGSDGSTPTGTQPLLYLHNEVPSFETNLGSGGGMTENGILGDGGADIP